MGKNYDVEEIGNYNGIDVFITSEDFYLTQKDVASHSVDRTGYHCIFIRREAWDLIQESTEAEELMQTLYEHEYSEYLDSIGEGENPHFNGRLLKEKKLLKFLKDKGYFKEKILKE